MGFVSIVSVCVVWCVYIPHFLATTEGVANIANKPPGARKYSNSTLPFRLSDVSENCRRRLGFDQAPGSAGLLFAAAQRRDWPSIRATGSSGDGNRGKAGMNIEGRRWLSVAEVSALLSVNPKTVSAWCLTHRLPAARIGGRGPWRIDRLRLEESLEAQIKNTGSAGFLGSGAPRRRGPCPAIHPKGQHERGGQELTPPREGSKNEDTEGPQARPKPPR